jgi:hypothetical protein
MVHPSYGPDLAPCDIFLLGAMKQTFAARHFATINDLLKSVDAFLRGLSADFLRTAFQEWIRRLQLCCEGGGEYAE